MASKKEVAARLAAQLAEIFSEEVYGSEGPELDCDIDEFEDLGVLWWGMLLSMRSLPGRWCFRTRRFLSIFPAPSANWNARSRWKNEPSKAGWHRPRFKNRFVIARCATELLFPQREILRLDSQNLTPRARRKAVYAGANERSHGVASKSLQELADGS